MVPLISMCLFTSITPSSLLSIIPTEQLVFIQMSLFSSIFVWAVGVKEPSERRKFDLVGIQETAREDNTFWYVHSVHAALNSKSDTRSTSRSEQMLKNDVAHLKTIISHFLCSLADFCSIHVQPDCRQIPKDTDAAFSV